jgi:hypothetical protein
LAAAKQNRSDFIDRRAQTRRNSLTLTAGVASRPGGFGKRQQSVLLSLYRLSARAALRRAAE